MTDHTQFRAVLRGYDPAQVDQVVAELTAAAEAARQEAATYSVNASKLEAGHGDLRAQLEAKEAQLVKLREATKTAAAPSFAGLGDRVGQILTLADEEAAHLRATAATEATEVRASAEAAAASVRADADRYAEDVRTRADAEAARTLEDAKRKADEILDHADRESSARREEAEAVYEHQRAKAAESAAEFETTLAARRDKAAAEFAAAMSQHESSLVAVQDRAAALASESDRAHQSAQAEVANMLEKARSEAASLVASARDQAERIKRDSDRELAAATARRDSITAQLTNVRQMLATLGGAGGSMLTPFAAAEAPAVQAPAADDAAAPGADAQTERPETAEAIERPTNNDEVENIPDVPDLAEELLEQAEGKGARRR